MKPSTNGHAKPLTDSPSEAKQAKVQKVDQEPESAFKVSPKKEKPAKSKHSEVQAGKDQDFTKKPAVTNAGAEQEKKQKEKDEGLFAKFWKENRLTMKLS